ncbi:MAG: hypothetical protein LQ342_006112 [Letrouitia transgressa]|nr:MAG: hypothetical protein LQ342_006112 [Letrouitia transgressa]
MLSRRTIRLALCPSPRTPTVSRCFNSSTRLLQTLQNEGTSSGAATTPQEARKTVPFDQSVARRLTPTMKAFTLEKKVAVITGGARGLGWNMAQALAEAGAQAIALLDLKQEQGERAAKELSSAAGVPAHFYKVDVCDAPAVNDVVARVVLDLGSVDILINSAGIVNSNIKAETYDVGEFRRLIDINLTGSFIVSQACGRHMMQQAHPHRGGSIIFISSIAGARVLHPQQQSAYNCSKAAVVQLARSLAAEWARCGIRVNTISPGYMDTQLNEDAMLQQQMKFWKTVTPMERVGKPDELNGLAVYLSSDAAGFVTGSNVFCDGGYHVY